MPTTFETTETLVSMKNIGGKLFYFYQLSYADKNDRINNEIYFCIIGDIDSKLFVKKPLNINSPIYYNNIFKHNSEFFMISMRLSVCLYFKHAEKIKRITKMCYNLFFICYVV